MYLLQIYTHEFELRLKNFINPNGRDINGVCCSGSMDVNGKCSGVCKTRFRVCLKEYQTQIDPKSVCNFGDVVTPILGENNINFTNIAPKYRLESFSNPIKFPFTWTWPVSTFFIFSIILNNINILGSQKTLYTPFVVMLSKLKKKKN